LHWYITRANATAKTNNANQTNKRRYKQNIIVTFQDAKKSFMLTSALKLNIDENKRFDLSPLILTIQTMATK
jgi:hypothetical protein